MLCATTQDACALMNWAHLRGVSIPDQLSLVNFDEISNVAATGLNPTFVCQPGEEIGARAVQLLVREIARKGEAKPVHLRLAPTLVVGNTTAPPEGSRREEVATGREAAMRIGRGAGPSTLLGAGGAAARLAGRRHAREITEIGAERASVLARKSLSSRGARRPHHHSRLQVGT